MKKALPLFFGLALLFATGTPSFGLKKEFNFMGLRLGMTPDEVKAVISQSSNLRIDETRYLGELNEANPFTLKASYFPFIRNVYIEFYRGKSYEIIVVLNPNYFDFFSLSETLEDKYGVPARKTSKRVHWQEKTNRVELLLEKPSTIKVYDDLLMRQLHSELSQTIIQSTNNSQIQSNKRSILNEL